MEPGWAAVMTFWEVAAEWWRCSYCVMWFWLRSPKSVFSRSRPSSNARPSSGLESEVLLTIIKSSGDLSLYIRFCFFPSMICLLGEEIWKAIFKIGNKTIHVFQEHLRVVLVVTFLVPAHSPDSSSLTFVLLRQWTLKSENFLCKNHMYMDYCCLLTFWQYLINITVI